ncbi:MAG TPA: AtpZ/AtpI family protein [Chitinophagales bacterium]|nr:AtpZ/AtpI family protein [Chitinophagales bacterium]
MKKDDNGKGPNLYLKYSGIGFQLAGSVALGVFMGYELDKWLKTKQPYFTMVFALIFLAGGMYLAFRDLVKDK